MDENEISVILYKNMHVTTFNWDNFDCWVVYNDKCFFPKAAYFITDLEVNILVIGCLSYWYLAILAFHSFPLTYQHFNELCDLYGNTPFKVHIRLLPAMRAPRSRRRHNVTISHFVPSPQASPNTTVCAWLDEEHRFVENKFLSWKVDYTLSFM